MLGPSISHPVNRMLLPFLDLLVAGARSVKYDIIRHELNVYLKAKISVGSTSIRKHKAPDLV